jgi:hypothetical protein
LQAVEDLKTKTHLFSRSGRSFNNNFIQFRQKNTNKMVEEEPEEPFDDGQSALLEMTKMI